MLADQSMPASPLGQRHNWGRARVGNEFGILETADEISWQTCIYRMPFFLVRWNPR